MTNIARRRVLVTGGSKGIGAATALWLADAGHPVTVHYGGDEDGAEAIAEQVRVKGGTADVVSFDISDRGQTREPI